MWINTEVTFEWSEKLKKYVEIHNEGYEYDGEVSLLMPSCDDGCITCQCGCNVPPTGCGADGCQPCAIACNCNTNCNDGWSSWRSHDDVTGLSNCQQSARNHFINNSWNFSIGDFWCGMGHSQSDSGNNPDATYRPTQGDDGLYYCGACQIMQVSWKKYSKSCNWSSPAGCTYCNCSQNSKYYDFRCVDDPTCQGTNPPFSSYLDIPLENYELFWWPPYDEVAGTDYCAYDESSIIEGCTDPEDALYNPDANTEVYLPGAGCQCYYGCTGNETVPSQEGLNIEYTAAGALPAYATCSQDGNPNCDFGCGNNGIIPWMCCIDSTGSGECDYPLEQDTVCGQDCSFLGEDWITSTGIVGDVVGCVDDTACTCLNEPGNGYAACAGEYPVECTEWLDENNTAGDDPPPTTYDQFTNLPTGGTLGFYNPEADYQGPNNCVYESDPVYHCTDGVSHGECLEGVCAECCNQGTSNCIVNTFASWEFEGCTDGGMYAYDGSNVIGKNAERWNELYDIDYPAQYADNDIDAKANNYNQWATYDDGTCVYNIFWCSASACGNKLISDNLVDVGNTFNDNSGPHEFVFDFQVYGDFDSISYVEVITEGDGITATQEIDGKQLSIDISLDDEIVEEGDDEASVGFRFRATVTGLNLFCDNDGSPCTTQATDSEECGGEGFNCIVDTIDVWWPGERNTGDSTENETFYTLTIYDDESNIYGCMDSNASNYNCATWPDAFDPEEDEPYPTPCSAAVSVANDSCVYWGCTDRNASNCTSQDCLDYYNDGTLPFLGWDGASVNYVDNNGSSFTNCNQLGYGGECSDTSHWSTSCEYSFSTCLETDTLSNTVNGETSDLIPQNTGYNIPGGTNCSDGICVTDSDGYYTIRDCDMTDDTCTADVGEASTCESTVTCTSNSSTCWYNAPIPQVIDTTQVYDTSITVNWHQDSMLASSDTYTISKNVDGGGFSDVVSVTVSANCSENQCSWTDTDIALNTDYQYKIKSQYTNSNTEYYEYDDDWHNGTTGTYQAASKVVTSVWSSALSHRMQELGCMDDGTKNQAWWDGTNDATYNYATNTGITTYLGVQACNYNSTAELENGSCTYPPHQCTDNNEGSFLYCTASVDLCNYCFGLEGLQEENSADGGCGCDIDVSPVTYYDDSDGDGLGDPNVSKIVCLEVDQAYMDAAGEATAPNVVDGTVNTIPDGYILDSSDFNDSFFCPLFVCIPNSNDVSYYESDGQYKTDFAASYPCTDNSSTCYEGNAGQCVDGNQVDNCGVCGTRNESVEWFQDNDGDRIGCDIVDSVRACKSDTPTYLAGGYTLPSESCVEDINDTDNCLWASVYSDNWGGTESTDIACVCDDAIGYDDCFICGGDDSSCTGCMDDDATNTDENCIHYAEADASTIVYECTIEDNSVCIYPGGGLSLSVPEFYSQYEPIYVNLVWFAQETACYYNIYRDGGLIGSTGDTENCNYATNTYVDDTSSLDYNTTYSYQVSAVTSFGTEGDLSEAVSVTTGKHGLPHCGETDACNYYQWQGTCNSDDTICLGSSEEYSCDGSSHNHGAPCQNNDANCDGGICTDYTVCNLTDCDGCMDTNAVNCTSEECLNSGYFYDWDPEDESTWNQDFTDCNQSPSTGFNIGECTFYPNLDMCLYNPSIINIDIYTDYGNTTIIPERNETHKLLVSYEEENESWHTDDEFTITWTILNGYSEGYASFENNSDTSDVWDPILYTADVEQLADVFYIQVQASISAKGTSGVITSFSHIYEFWIGDLDVYGCMDELAINYNPNATREDAYSTVDDNHLYYFNNDDSEFDSLYIADPPITYCLYADAVTGGSEGGGGINPSMKLHDIRNSTVPVNYSFLHQATIISYTVPQSPSFDDLEVVCEPNSDDSPSCYPRTSCESGGIGIGCSSNALARIMSNSLWVGNPDEDENAMLCVDAFKYMCRNDYTSQYTCDGPDDEVNCDVPITPYYVGPCDSIENHPLLNDSHSKCFQNFTIYSRYEDKYFSTNFIPGLGWNIIEEDINGNITMYDDMVWNKSGFIPGQGLYVFYPGKITIAGEDKDLYIKWDNETN